MTIRLERIAQGLSEAFTSFRGTLALASNTFNSKLSPVEECFGMRRTAVTVSHIV